MLGLATIVLNAALIGVDEAAAAGTTATGGIATGRVGADDDGVDVVGGTLFTTLLILRGGALLELEVALALDC